MAEPVEITYQRWWTVYPSRGEQEDFASEEEAVRRAVELLKGDAFYVNISRTDRPKR